ncbi:unnamed protein product [Polarella glacialis]|uniref:Rab-GAP TBC domain-containing protein n=1 Tax=Polarella glacialis TaxID=89957 RepID=A0A813L3I4_POLGL|nr:unnamed protein product [Polarella glacialis]
MVCSSSKHAEKTFWDDQFANSIYGDTYEWVADFEVIAPALQPLLAVQGGAGSCRVLHLGCGNSELPEQLYDFLGVRSCTNVDFSRRYKAWARSLVTSLPFRQMVLDSLIHVIDQMRQRNAALRPELSWVEGDCSDLHGLFKDGSFDLVLERGLLDAVACASDLARRQASLRSVLDEVVRLLADGGVYFLATVDPDRPGQLANAFESDGRCLGLKLEKTLRLPSPEELTRRDISDRKSSIQNTGQLAGNRPMQAEDLLITPTEEEILRQGFPVAQVHPWPLNDCPLLLCRIAEDSGFDPPDPELLLRKAPASGCPSERNGPSRAEAREHLRCILAELVSTLEAAPAAHAPEKPTILRTPACPSRPAPERYAKACDIVPGRDDRRVARAARARRFVRPWWTVWLEDVSQLRRGATDAHRTKLDDDGWRQSSSSNTTTTGMNATATSSNHNSSQNTKPENAGSSLAADGSHECGSSSSHVRSFSLSAGVALAETDARRLLIVTASKRITEEEPSDDLRPALWLWLAQDGEVDHLDPVRYHELCERNLTGTASFEAEQRLQLQRQIVKDLERTPPDLFIQGTRARAAALGASFASADARSAAAERLLLAFSRHRPEIGYCQGLNFVAATLLRLLDEQSAFGVFCSLIERLPRDLYSCDPERIAVCRLAQQDRVLRLLKAERPALAAHIEVLELDLNLFLPRWLTCLFASVLPTPATLRLWDYVLGSDGTAALIRVALAVLIRVESRLLAAADLGEALDVLASAVDNVTPEDVDSMLRSEWTAKRLERSWSQVRSLAEEDIDKEGNHFMNGVFLARKTTAEVSEDASTEASLFAGHDETVPVLEFLFDRGGGGCGGRVPGVPPSAHGNLVRESSTASILLGDAQ